MINKQSNNKHGGIKMHKLEVYEGKSEDYNVNYSRLNLRIVLFNTLNHKNVFFAILNNKRYTTLRLRGEQLKSMNFASACINDERVIIELDKSSIEILVDFDRKHVHIDVNAEDGTNLFFYSSALEEVQK